MNINTKEMDGLKDRLKAKGWSKLKQMAFLTKLTSVSIAATNNLCYDCKLIAYKKAKAKEKSATYCESCQKNFEEALRPLLEEANK